MSTPLGCRRMLTMNVALALAAVLAAGALYEAIAARNDGRRSPPPGALIDVGGFRMHLNCSGSGGPVVVLDAGLGDSNLDWSIVQDRLARTTRVCSYDRAGIAWSEPGPAPRTAARAVEELAALLEAAGEAPPYVLVGHSAGANYVRLFAHRFPERVKGLVLIEPPLLTAVSPAAVAAFSTIRGTIGAMQRVGVIRLMGRWSLLRVLFGGAPPPPGVSAHAGFLYRPQSVRASIQEIRALPETVRRMNQAAVPGAWRDWPVVILAARVPSSGADRLSQALERLAGLSTRGRVVRAESSHFVHFERPDVVVRVIQDVVEAPP